MSDAQDISVSFTHEQMACVGDGCPYCDDPEWSNSVWPSDDLPPDQGYLVHCRSSTCSDPIPLSDAGSATVNVRSPWAEDQPQWRPDPEPPNPQAMH